MSTRLWPAALLWAAAAVSGRASSDDVDHEPGSVRTVVVVGPDGGDTLHIVTPTFLIRTAGFSDPERPLTLRLQLSADSLFAGQLVVDTSVVGDSAVVALSRPLPEGARLFWRAAAQTATGEIILSAVTGPRLVPLWVTPVTPSSPVGSTLRTPRPVFIWTAAAVSSPPGPWTFDFEILNAGTGVTVVAAASLLDTLFVPTADLESNVSYRWAVTARLATGESIRRESEGTFVIVGTDAPRVTILFQNFPNPFPTATTARTCIWFDLRAPGSVRLEVFDIRGNLARTLVPSGEIPGAMDAGRYGRTSSNAGGSGCDERFSWDGSAQDGRVVPPGIYLLRLRADGIVATRRMVFRGR